MVFITAFTVKTLLLLSCAISTTFATGSSNRIRPAGQPWIKTVITKRLTIPLVLSGASLLQSSTTFVACQISQEASLAVDSMFGTHNAQDCKSLLLAISPTSTAVTNPIEYINLSSKAPTATLASYQNDLSKIHNLSTASAASPSSAITVGVVSGTNHGCTPSNSSVCAIQAEALTGHNTIRTRHHVAPLVWNDTLAVAALKWSNMCTWGHSPIGSILPVTTHYGESIYASTGKDIMSTAVASFSVEESEYDYTNPGFTQLTGQFTQVVWKDSTSVGCALIQCNLAVFAAQTNSSTLAVCLYYPAGNVNSISAFQENVLPI